MKFTEKHKVYLQNTLNILRKAKLPDVSNGEEYLVYAQSYYFIYDLLQIAEQEIKSDKVLVPTPPTTNSATPKKTKSSKEEAEG